MFVQALSNTVLKALHTILGEEAKGTIEFVDMFDKFFDCVNVRNFVSGLQSKNPFKSPYQSKNDFRLQVFILCCVIGYMSHKKHIV